tara:strand:- start:1430 stop:3163 length:1734 start_codon:yes stop_codon:yes gene_type:complete
MIWVDGAGTINNGTQCIIEFNHVVDGDTGACGPVGGCGPQGAQGLGGAAGSCGPQGLQGTQGLQGSCGPQGGIGPQGKGGAAATTLYTSDKRVTTQFPIAKGDIALYNGSNFTDQDWQDITKIYMYKEGDNSAEINAASFPIASDLKIYHNGYENSAYCIYRVLSSSYASNRVEVSVSMLPTPDYAGQIEVASGAPTNDFHIIANAQNQGADGAACFVGDTIIQTTSGAKLIEDIEDGDKVVSVSFDPNTNKRSNRVATVKNKVDHGSTKVITVEHDGAGQSFTCTPDHFIFQPDGSYKEARHFCIGDKMIDAVNREDVTVTKISKAKEEKTYNFEVDPYKNYIANNILVHNGGASKVTTLDTPVEGDLLVFSEDSVWETVPLQLGGHSFQTHSSSDIVDPAEAIAYGFNPKGHETGFTATELTDGYQLVGFAQETLEDSAWVCPFPMIIPDSFGPIFVPLNITNGDLSVHSGAKAKLSIFEVEPDTANNSAYADPYMRLRWQSNEVTFNYVNLNPASSTTFTVASGANYKFEPGKVYVFSISNTLGAIASAKIPEHSIAWRFKVLANQAPFDIYTD